MRRIVAIVAVGFAIVALFVAGTGAGGDDGGTYEIRAIFDNASFTVTDEDVRVAGAKVGFVSDIDITGNDEIATEDGQPAPGKAVVVMQITDEAFQDFREDGSCLIRPQSLIGEKFVECEPTQPRAPGTEPPPALTQIPDGEPGEGQYLLPVERNSKTVDVDLVNDIMKEPYPDRFRLILNDLGAGLAARGDELGEIIERSNPALRELNSVLAILARENHDLANLASDGDAIVTALARRRENVAGFINSSTVVGQATAERQAELEEGFAKLPQFLRELRSTMTELQSFSEAATPVFADLGAAAPSLTKLNEESIPFSEASTDSVVSLGTASAAAKAPLSQSDPVIRQIRGLATDAAPATKNLSKFLASLRKTNGFKYFFEAIFGLGGTVNGFDQYGHFLRALIPVQNCFDYTSIPQSGCSAKFPGTINTTKGTPSADDEDKAAKHGRHEAGAEPQPGQSTGDDGAQGGVEATPEPTTPTTPEPPTTPADPEQTAPDVDAAPASPEGAAPDDGDVDSSAGPRFRAARSILDFLIGNPHHKRGGKR
jgi:ABC-type transporter Mla subunit MlaD